MIKNFRVSLKQVLSKREIFASKTLISGNPSRLDPPSSHAPILPELVPRATHVFFYFSLLFHHSATRCPLPLPSPPDWPFIPRRVVGCPCQRCDYRYIDTKLSLHATRGGKEVNTPRGENTLHPRSRHHLAFPGPCHVQIDVRPFHSALRRFYLIELRNTYLRPTSQFFFSKSRIWNVKGSSVFFSFF